MAYELKHINPVDATQVGIALAQCLLASKAPDTTDAEADEVVDNFFKVLDEVVGRYGERK